MWIVETTPSRARNRSPSSVSTPTQRPRSSSSRLTVRSQRTAPPSSTIERTSASVSRPEPPSGRVQPRRWRPKTIEYASGPEPVASTGTSVWNDCQSMNACTCGLSNSVRTTSQALIIRRRSQRRPSGWSASIRSSDGPKPGGVNRAAPKRCLTESYSAIIRR